MTRLLSSFNISVTLHQKHFSGCRRVCHTHLQRSQVPFQTAHTLCNKSPRFLSPELRTPVSCFTRRPQHPLTTNALNTGHLPGQCRTKNKAWCPVSVCPRRPPPNPGPSLPRGRPFPAPHRPLSRPEGHGDWRQTPSTLFV